MTRYSNHAVRSRSMSLSQIKKRGKEEDQCEHQTKWSNKKSCSLSFSSYGGTQEGITFVIRNTLLPTWYLSKVNSPPMDHLYTEANIKTIQPANISNGKHCILAFYLHPTPYLPTSTKPHTNPSYQPTVQRARRHALNSTTSNPLQNYACIRDLHEEKLWNRRHEMRNRHTPSSRLTSIK